MSSEWKMTPVWFCTPYVHKGPGFKRYLWSLFSIHPVVCRYINSVGSRHSLVLYKLKEDDFTTYTCTAGTSWRKTTLQLIHVQKVQAEGRRLYNLYMYSRYKLKKDDFTTYTCPAGTSWRKTTLQLIHVQQVQAEGRWLYNLYMYNR